jgi:hypothetical protein
VRVGQDEENDDEDEAEENFGEQSAPSAHFWGSKFSILFFDFSFFGFFLGEGLSLKHKP